MTYSYSYRPSIYEITAFSEEALGSNVGSGSTFTMPSYADLCITVKDDDRYLSGDSCYNENANDRSYQTARILQDDTDVGNGGQIYAEQYFWVKDQDGNWYVMIEIEQEGTNDDYFTFYTGGDYDVPPAGAELTVHSKCNVTSNWLKYDQLDAGDCAPPTGSISGTVFCDTDCDGVNGDFTVVPGNDYVVEAESMYDCGFKTVSGDQASGGKLVKLACNSGVLKTYFDGEDGTYGFRLTAQDESDGQSRIHVKVNGVLIDVIKLDRDTDGGGSNNGGFSDFVIEGLELTHGDKVELYAYSDGNEYVRIDKIAFEGEDTVDYTPEPVKAGVLIKLLDLDGNVIAETATDADGNYSFDDVPVGDYRIMGVAPDGTVFTIPDVDGNGKDDIDSDVGADGLSGVISVAAGETYDVDLGVCVDDDCIKILENTTAVIDLDCGTGGNKDIGLDLCVERDALRDAGVDAGKLAALTLQLGDALTTDSSTDQNGKLDVGVVLGAEDGDGQLYVRVSDDDDPTKTDRVYFEGAVGFGDSFTALAADGGRNEFGSETYVHIFDDDGTLLQTINFHTSCSAPIAIGDQYGSVSLAGGALLDKDTGGLIEYGTTSEPGDEGVTYSIVGGADAALFRVDPDTGEVSFIDPPDYENPLDEGADNTYDVIVRCTKDDDSFEDTPLEVCVEDQDCIKILENTDPGVIADLDCEENDEKPDLGLEICEEIERQKDNGVDLEKPSELTLTLGDVIGTDPSGYQPDGKSSVSTPGTEDGDGAIRVLVTDDDDPTKTDTVYFEGDLSLGDTFTALASNAGEDKFSSNTYIHIFDDDGALIQTIQIHTSCSAPIVIGDTIGSVTLTGVGLPVKDSGEVVRYGGSVSREVVYEITGGDGFDPANGTSPFFNVDPATGEVTLGFNPDFENPLDDNGDNSYFVEVTGYFVNADGSREVCEVTPVEICIEDAVEPGALSGRYFCDTNDNDIDDGQAVDPGIAGVKVTLFDAAGVALASTLTGPEGQYSFTGLDAGTYSVQFTDPNGVLAGKQLVAANVGSDDAIDSDAIGDTTLSEITDIVVVAGGEARDNDAGAEYLGALGDTVWFDADGDGLQDAAEPGVANVTVTLTGAGDDGVLGTADDTTAVQVTDGNGTYLFEDLGAGDYKVTFSDLPAGYVFTAPNAGADDAIDSDAGAGGMTGPITLAAGETNLTVDAGIVIELGSLSGRYFCDTNDNDIDDGESEPPIEGVLVELLDANGGATGITTTTGPDGSYRFTGLEPGTYGVRFTDPAGVLAGKQLVAANVGSDDAIDSDAIGDITLSTISDIVVVGGLDAGDNDAGVEYANTPPEATPDAGKGCADEEIRVDLADNISDADGDPVTITAVGGVALTEGGPAVNVGGVFVRLEGTELVFDGEAAFAGLDIGEEDTATFTYSIEDGNGGLAVSTVEVTFCGDANSVGSFCDSLPDQIQYQIRTSSVALPYGDEAFDIKFTSTDARFDGVIIEAAYCLSLFDPADGAESFDMAALLTADVFCFDDAPADLFNAGQIGIANGKTAMENLDVVNWVLNQDFGDQGYTDWEIQRTIWELTDNVDTDYTSDIDPAFGDDANVDALVALALEFDATKTEEFTPGVGDTIGVILDPNPATGSNSQPFILGIDFDAYDCLC